MSFNLDHVFRVHGLRAVDNEPCLGDIPDDTLGAFVDGLLSQSERQRIADRLLLDPEAYDIVRAVADAVGLRSRPTVYRIVARVVQDGLELLNGFELTLRQPSSGELVPALGAVRGENAQQTDLLHFDGPGGGLDEIEMQKQADGTARVVVTSHDLPALEEAESPSIVLECDGKTREMRPLTDQPVTFGPLREGSYDLKLIARAPGSTSRTLAEASIQLLG